MRTGLLWLLPDEVLPLLLPLAAIGLIIGVVTGRTVMAVIGLLIFLPLIGGIAEGVFSALPAWLSLGILAVIGISILRGVAALLIGQRAADTMTGNLAADIVRLVVVCLFFPFRLVGWFFRNGRV